MTGKSSSNSSSMVNLPKSICNAPPEMHDAIRRVQNNESSRRSRARKRQKIEGVKTQIERAEQKIKDLENQVANLEAILVAKRESRKRKGGSKDDSGSALPKVCTPPPGEHFEPDQPFFGDAFWWNIASFHWNKGTCL